MQNIKPFNLTTEPWIVATPQAGGASQEFSLHDIIAHAHELRELSDASPLVTVGTLRLLLALLYRVCAADGESFTRKDWQRIRTDGKFPTEALKKYLEEWNSHFDLFHSEYPFYQTSKLEMDTPKSLNCLAADSASGNNPVLWQHSTDAEMQAYTPAQAARLLVAAQSFALAGLLRAKGRMEDKEFNHGSAFNAAIPPGAALWLSGGTLCPSSSEQETKIGDNLFVTLMLNLAPQEDDSRDAPCWELEPPWKYRDREKALKKGAQGAMDRFTWQSRLIRLLPEMQNGQTVVRGCYVTQGRSADTSPDPMHSYYASQKSGKVIVRLSDRKAAWRDAHAIFDRNDRAEKPAAFDFMMKLANIEEIPPARLYQVHVAGIANDQAKVLLWRHDRMSVPVALLQDANLEAWLGVWMGWAGSGEWQWSGKKCFGMARKLRNATRDVVALYLAPGNRQPAPDDVGRLTDALDPLGFYWSRLEPHFYTLLRKLGEAIDAPTERQPALRQDAAKGWAADIQRVADEAFKQAVVRGLGNSTRAIEAVARVHTPFPVELGNYSEAARDQSGDNRKEIATTP